MSDQIDPVFEHDSYAVRRKLLSFLGQKFYIYDGAERMIGFVKQAAFKLKEDIRVFPDENCRQGEEILIIKARSIIDFSACYDVIDARAQVKVGALRRRGLKSMLRDTWDILDSSDTEYGIIEEDSMAMAVLRRFINIIPQKFSVKAGSRQVATFAQTWNIFVPRLTVTFHGGQEEIDRRIGLAAAVLISAIEGRQQ
jgi:hypothetical protein